MRALHLSAALAISASATVASAATVGFVMDFNSGMGDFGGGSSSYTLVPSGGVGGAGDGFLTVTNTSLRQLGVRTAAPEFTGNLTNDGVTGFSFWLKDVGAANAAEIHVGVGNNFTNFWQSKQGFVPGPNWTEFTVDLDPANWVQIIGGGTFANALHNSDRLLFRHDLAPFDQIPDSAIGDFGIDRIEVLPEPSALLLLAGAGLLALRPRR